LAFQFKLILAREVMNPITGLAMKEDAAPRELGIF
jgi:hypothetical protein